MPCRAPRARLGAELKSTFCVAKGERAWVGHHIGDLKTYEVLHAFEAGIEHFERLFAVVPEVVAHDLHPDYLSTRYALGARAWSSVAVQHHHAHLAACLAEHGETGPAVGAIYDGTRLRQRRHGVGRGAARRRPRGFERAGHLWPVRLPGGDRAVRQPWRMAVSWLLEAGWDGPLPGPDPRRAEQVGGLVRSGLSSPVTTSMGRLFDAIAALCGLRAEVTTRARPRSSSRPPRTRGARRLRLPVKRRRRARRAAGGARGGARHGARRRGGDRLGALPRARSRARTRRGGEPGRPRHRRALRRRVQNRTLLSATAARLEARGLRVLVPERLPPNDGGVLRPGGGGGGAALARALRAAPARPVDREVAEAGVVAELGVRAWRGRRRARRGRGSSRGRSGRR